MNPKLHLKFENKLVGVIGDIHGNFEELHKILKHVTNSVIFVIGDCGFGFPDTKQPKIKKMIKSSFDAFLKKRDLHLIFMRGNHDDPTYFNNEQIRNNISTDRFILIPDYTVVTVDDVNILCVGGAVSVDRRFRRTGTSYWYEEEMLDITYIENINIDILLTHTISKQFISHKLPPMPDWLKISFDVDKKLKPDSAREDRICEELYNYYHPKLWYHGHFHESHKTPLNHSRIIGVDINELIEIDLRIFKNQ